MLDCAWINVNLLGLFADVAGAIVLVAGLLSKENSVRRVVVNTTMMGAPSNTTPLLVERSFSWADGIVGATYLSIGFIGQALSDHLDQSPAAWRAYGVGVALLVVLLALWRVARQPVARSRAFALAMANENDASMLNELCAVAIELGLPGTEAPGGAVLVNYEIAVRVWGYRLHPSRGGRYGKRRARLCRYVEEIRSRTD